MGENLLSSLHIQKLGHSLEEIRIRALSSVISKYNLNLVDEDNYENMKLLLEKLLNWFNYEKIVDEKRVLNLLLKLLKNDNANLIFTKSELNEIYRRVKDIGNKIGHKYSAQIDEIKECIKIIEDRFEAKSSEKSNCALITNKLTEINPKTHGDGNKLPKKSSSALCNGKRPVAVNEQYIPDKFELKRNIMEKQQEVLDYANICFKIEFFPWQYLVHADKKVLSSVFDGLKYTDDKISILKSCQFFTEVVLRDFPPEIFMQRPLLIRTFLQLIRVVESDVRISVIKCLTRTIQHIQNSIKEITNQSVFNQKKEFYTTAVFPDEIPGVVGDDFDKRNLQESFHLNFTSAGDFTSNQELSLNDNKLKKFQLSLPQLCFEVLMEILPHLKESCSKCEMNALIEMINEFIICLLVNLKPELWKQHYDLKDKFYKILKLLNDLLKYFKRSNRIIYITLVNIVVKILNSLKPSRGVELCDILPRELQLELGLCIVDSYVFLMFPQLHSELLKFVGQFSGEKEKDFLQDYKEVLTVLESMKSCITFLKFHSKFKTKLEKLECAYQALPSLDFHKNFDFINSFVHSCLLKWSTSQLKDKELKLRDKVLLKLLSHSCSAIKIYIYRELNALAEKLLGEEQAARPTYEFPGDKMEFLFGMDILTEVICHGLNSEDSDVCKYSNNVMVYLLKSKFIMSEQCWNEFMSALIPCFSLLQCYADKSTALGRCIIKTFDPDVARTLGLPQIEVIKGNIRLLFSKNNLTRDEAISRLFWLLSKEDLDNKKLPKMSVLTGLNLSGICSSVKPQKYTKMEQSFYNHGKLCDVVEMLNSENLEPNLRRSALSQLCVMLEDTLLHSTFLEQKGLNKILRILDSSLIERDYHNYPDSVIPVIEILKILSFQNVFVCHELSTQISVLYNVLRSLLLFSSDEKLRRNAVELLCLLLYGDCILRIPPDKSTSFSISLPEIVVKKICLPFFTRVHWKNSKHLEPSMKRTLLSKEPCSKLIRIYWAKEWVGNLTDFLSVRDSNIQEKAYSPGIPEDLKISYGEIEDLIKCSFSLSVKQTLRNIQNATTHEAVYSCIYKLHCYFYLYNLEKSNREKSASDASTDTILSHMLWESTLERFMFTMPNGEQDEALLLLVVQFIRVILGSLKSERFINWTEKLLIDSHKPLYRVLKNLDGKDSSLKGRELRLSVIELSQQIITSKVVDSDKWFPYMELISDYLKLNKKKEFHNVAYVDWLVGLLVDLTGRCSFSHKLEYQKTLIVRIMEIIIAFHCTEDSIVSFIGMNIIKNSIFVLNHILSDMQANVEDWEEIWFQSLSRVIGHADNVNYCWLLSFWFMRDPFVRAASFQLFVGFSTTAKGCELLIDKLNIPFEHVWTQGFRVLFDDRECSIVREQSGLLLSNLTSHGTKLSTGNFLNHLQKISFYQNIFEIIGNYHCETRLPELALDKVNNIFIGEVVTTPALVTSISKLLQNIISIDVTEVCEKIFETGTLQCLNRVLGEIPESTSNCEKHQYCVDILLMYISVCRLIRKCVTSCSNARLFILHSQNSINHIFSMVNYNLFCESSKTITGFKNELWCEIFDLFSCLLIESSEGAGKEQSERLAFLALNRSMTETGVDNFTSSLYIALTSDVHKLRLSVLQFLINLFRHEMDGDKTVTVGDVFERKISEKSLKLSKNFGSKELEISEKLTLTFGIRLTDALLQIFSMSSECNQFFKRTAADALGSLFAVFHAAQDFCLNRNFSASLMFSLKEIHAKLSLENVANLKKLSDKKKIGPLLQDLEMLFQLLNNYTYNNEQAKSDVANRALSVVVHKLWPWCVLKPSLHVVTLKMLCTFTHSCSLGCRSLGMSSNLTVICLRKMPGSVTLMNAITNQIMLEMDSACTTKADGSDVLCLCLQVLSNCCSATECRSVLAKGNFLQCFAKVAPNRKRKPHAESIVESWLEFFEVFSSHQEGQLALAKNQDLVDCLIGTARSPNVRHRVGALIVLRNICFHQVNRYRMLSCCPFVSLLLETLSSGTDDELRHVLHASWALSCNSQKAKVILRSSGFDAKLEAAKKKWASSKHEDIADLASVVLGILKNK